MFKQLGNCGKSLNVRQWSSRNYLHNNYINTNHAQGKLVERQGRKARDLRLELSS